MDEVLAVLQHEFRSEPGTFLIRLRSDLEWDRTAFSRVEQAMRTVCQRTQDDPKLDRWIAEGFYEMATGVPAWTSHPNFPQPQPDSYYTDCIERLSDLSDWYFRGEHNYLHPHTWTNL